VRIDGGFSHNENISHDQKFKKNIRRHTTETYINTGIMGTICRLPDF